MPYDILMLFDTAGTVVQSADFLANYFSQTGEEVPIGTTIGPVRGEMMLFPTVETAIDRKVSIEQVLQLVPEGGRATLPSAGIEIVDGMWYGPMFWGGQNQEAATGVFAAAARIKPFETRAMRKVTGNGQELRVYGVSNSNADYSLRFIGVLMLKLP